MISKPLFCMAHAPINFRVTDNPCHAIIAHCSPFILWIRNLMHILSDKKFFQDRNLTYIHTKFPQYLEFIYKILLVKIYHFDCTF